MFKNKEKAQLEAIREALRTTARGIDKRIDENRELLELLQAEGAAFLNSHPWIVGWLKGQDDFLVALQEAAKVDTKDPPESARIYGFVSGNGYPRPWPDVSVRANATGVRRAEGLAQHAQSVFQAMNEVMWEAILQAFEAAAAELGVCFVRNGEALSLSLDERNKLGEAAMAARLKFLSPGRPLADIKEQVSRDALDGDAVCWADGIIRSLKGYGISVMRLSNFEEQQKSSATS